MNASQAALEDKRHVVVSGNHTEVVVIDVWRMQIISIIRGHQDWVTGVFPCSLTFSNGTPTGRRRIDAPYS